jgi:hypothetical protein
MEETKTQKTCEQRIDQELKSRLEDLLPDVTTWSGARCARYLKREGRTPQTADVDELRQEVLDLIRERACEDLLSLEKITTYKLCLSWGGPADYFELDWSEDSRCWVGGRYVFQDWFDGADRQIPAEQVEQIAEVYGIYPEAA